MSDDRAAGRRRGRAATEQVLAGSSGVGAAAGRGSSMNSAPPTSPVTIVARNQSSPTATPASVCTPYGASSSTSSPSRTPAPLMLIGTAMASATSGTTANHAASGSTTPSARPMQATAMAPPICTMKLQPMALRMSPGCSW